VLEKGTYRSAKDEERVVMAPGAQSEAPAQPAPPRYLPRFVFPSMDLSALPPWWPLVSRWAGARPSIIAHIRALCKNYPTPSFDFFSKLHRFLQ
jgi:hypothetical protein